MKKQPLTFQNLIVTLNRFWSEKGVIIGQPYGLEVGAGTANPLTFLRVLGPESFNVAYVEPSRRPDDGRYGENPNRLQHYYQYQIILKPAPLFNQELFIQMLMELGINPEEHDLRFVEDNWESPAIGAWGLGWEVWLDGMEIAQYTYFQQVASIPLEVPALEITLGLERIAMYIQDVNDYKDILWNDSTKYGDLFTQHEYWQSKYNFEEADIKKLQELFDIHRQITEELLEKGNYWVAYDNLLKMSHIFNILDARGAISLTDRIQRFQLMGKLSKKIGLLYLEEREKLNYPLLKNNPQVKVSLLEEEVKLEKGDDADRFLIELGFEELPTEFLINWSKELTKETILEVVKEYGFNVSLKDIEIGLTPLRLVVELKNIASEGIVTEVVSGPTKIASFVDKKPSPALLGFVKKYNKSIDDVIWKSKNGKNVATIKIEKKFTITDLAQNIIKKLFDVAPRVKYMRWNDSKNSFIRPLRHILALYGDENLNVNYFDLKSSDWTLAPRYIKPTIVKIRNVSEYETFVRKYGIELNFEKRSSVIEKQIPETDLEHINPDYIEVNSALTESPKVHFVNLPDKFYKLPQELIIKVLEKHQKYLVSAKGSLDKSNRVVKYGVVANASKPNKVIFDGNAKVVNARLEDAVFYYNQDRKRKLVDFRKDLKKITFHKNVGTYYEKAERVTYVLERSLSDGITFFDYYDLEPLLYNDKATMLVTEFPDLEGVVGFYYALEDGIPYEKASLLKEMRYKVKEYSKDGRFLALTDRIDSLSALAFAGELPKGSNDPYSTRKLVYEILELVKDFDIDINVLIEFDLEILEKQFPKQASKYRYNEVLEDLLNFFSKRIFLILKEENSQLPEHILKGVAYGGRDWGVIDFWLIKKTFKTLNDLYAESPEKVEELSDAIKRLYNIVKNYESKYRSPEDLDYYAEPDELLFEKEIEKKLNDWKFMDFSRTEILEFINILNSFFENVMVMVDDPQLRLNRIRLLRQVLDKVEEFIDYWAMFAKVE